MPLAFVTGNSDKFSEVNSVLKRHGIDLMKGKIKVTEEGKTLKERSLSKVAKARGSLKGLLISDDTGLFLEAFKDFPGVHSKKVFEEIGFEGILQNLKGNIREAYFKTVICLMDENNKTHFFEGKLKGTIAENISNVEKKKQLPYTRIFIPEGYSKPMSELSDRVRAKISHRTRAAERLAEFLKRNAG